jgi:hypothetical protein
MGRSNQRYPGILAITLLLSNDPPVIPKKVQYLRIDITE